MDNRQNFVTLLQTRENNSPPPKQEKFVPKLEKSDYSTKGSPSSNPSPIRSVNKVRFISD